MALARESDELADEPGGALDGAVADLQRWRRGLRRGGGGGEEGRGGGGRVGRWTRRCSSTIWRPFSRFIDSVMDNPVVRAALVSAVHTVQKTAETPLVTVQFLEIVDMLVVCTVWCRGRDRAVNCGVPQLQCFDRWLM